MTWNESVGHGKELRACVTLAFIPELHSVSVEAGLLDSAILSAGMRLLR
jgi:hypothetical protein